jgi:hypothetical protein
VCPLDAGRLHEIARAIVGVEQRRDLGPQPRIAGTGLVKKGPTLFRVTSQRGIEDPAHLPPLFRFHRLSELLRRTTETCITCPDSGLRRCLGRISHNPRADVKIHGGDGTLIRLMKRKTAP